MFQFHKVRLKGTVPQGNYTIPAFQFHKVRLKGKYKVKQPAHATFQFHKVRLKVAYKAFRANTNASFNSIRYD